MNPNNQNNSNNGQAPSARPNNGSKQNGRQNNRPKNSNNRRTNSNPSQPAPAGRSVSRGAAMRAQKRNLEDATRIANQHLDASSKGQVTSQRANFIDDTPRLKIVGLGGMDGGGSKNTILVEYMNDAIIMD